MALSQREQRILAEMAHRLAYEDPRFAGRLHAFNARIDRQERGRAPRRKRASRPRRRITRATVFLTASWLIVATLIVTLLVLALRHDAAAAALTL
ncbi:DUF3040 domain-containing protein [Rhizohabitans arisaemae]|uniref:DUF3040 domain-containing protein n=1 Tax=Rhizohabitans arisaemae TaxID=2720610 RepID=UPI0024B1DB05|nr:DUF3040 domain-containing protein [Rhizohabitans arisaemae]